MALAEKLKDTVGTENFLDDPDTLARFSGDMSFVPRVRPRYAVRPKNAADVQALIRLARESETPLVPVSSGEPRFRGDTVPSTGGAVMVDLSALKQIIRIDRRNRVAMIEAGVTFADLVPALAREGLRLNMPLVPRKSKSVIASMLERQPVIMPVFQWDAMDPLLCTEVYFGTGDRFRTGSAAGPGTLEQQWNAAQAQLNPMGPGQADIARVVQGAQGTMGIVTWASVRCEALPALQKPFLVGIDNIGEAADFIYTLLWLRSAEECVLLNKVAAAGIAAGDKGEFEALKRSLPNWLFFFSLSGYRDFPEERIAYQEEQIFEAAGRFGVKPVETLPGFSARMLLDRLSKPSEDPYWKLRSKGACEDIFFLATLDKASGFVRIMRDAATEFGYNPDEIAAYVQPMVQGVCCHCEFTLFYDPASRKEAARIKQISAAAAERMQRNGAFFSRPYGPWAALAFERQGDTVSALKKAKEIFDPSNIMNPGKLCF